MKHVAVVIIVYEFLSFSQATFAAVTKYTNKAQWESLVGDHATITFSEIPYPSPDYITTQYSYLGVTFADGNDVQLMSNSLVNDNLGLYGNLPGDTIVIEFDAPITSFAIDHPGVEAFKLYANGQQIFDTSLMGGAGTGFFSGVISTLAFDKVVIQDPLGGGGTIIDDLHFGPPIPAPGALALFGLASAMSVQRRRRRA